MSGRRPTWSVGANRTKHADQRSAAVRQCDGEIAGPRAEIEHAFAAGQCQRRDRTPAPAAIDAGREQVIEEVVPAGTEFSFEWQAKGDSATLENLKGEKIDSVKGHLEGKYEQKSR